MYVFETDVSQSLTLTTKILTMLCEPHTSENTNLILNFGQGLPHISASLQAKSEWKWPSICHQQCPSGGKCEYDMGVMPFGVPLSLSKVVEASLVGTAPVSG
jgi:hypothetical protein